MSEQRRERREQERANVKGYEEQAKLVRQALEDRPDHDEFKQAILAALERLDLTDHANNLVAAQLIMGAVQAEKRQDEIAAKLMLYMSGVIVNAELTLNVIRVLDRGLQHAPVARLPRE